MKFAWTLNGTRAVLARRLWLSPVAWASLPQPQYHLFKMSEDQLAVCHPRPLIDLYDPPGIPLKPNLVSFSNMNPCLSNQCHKWTILVHLLAFWVSFLQVVQAQKIICFDMQTAASAYAALATAQQTNGFRLWDHPFRMQGMSMFKVHCVWNFQDFLWPAPGSRMAVLEPRYPVVGQFMNYSWTDYENVKNCSYQFYMQFIDRFISSSEQEV